MRILLAALLFLLAAGPVAAKDAVPTQTALTLTYDTSLGVPSFTGRVYLFTTQRRGEPRFGPNWFQPEPFFSVDVTDWKAGEPIVLHDPQYSFPMRLPDLPRGTYSMQAVMRLNPHAQSVGRGEGNAYSAAQAVTVARTGEMKATLHIDQRVPEKPFDARGPYRHHKIRSEKLSAFHGRDVLMHAAVVLPEGYDASAKRRYPTLYIIPGFGGSYHSCRQYVRKTHSGHEGDIVRVLLDSQCGTGHHVYADSANNGPWATALVTELIPSLEAAYRLVPAPTARFLSGISSGGWSSLWLQVKHPDFFGGVWSFAPDPVDFRDFQRINLYKPGANMFRDGKRKRRPLARHGGRVMVWYDDFVKMETALGDGGQIGSFEWVFSPRAKDGGPRRVFDRATGAVDTAVAKTWEAYDIRLLLAKNWRALKPKLKGKLNVFMGGKDTFYLDGATRLLEKSMRKLRSGAVIEIHEQHDHSSIYNPQLLKRVDRELMARFRKAHPKEAR